MKKFKIVHIHSDTKFINESYRFYGEQFENSIFIIGLKDSYNGELSESVKYFNSSKSEFNKIISICNNADMVVMHNLNFPKSYIANRLHKSVKIAWRFFGSELYSRKPELVYSERTNSILDKQKKNGNFYNFKNKIINYLVSIKYMASPNKEFEKAAFKRIDYFLGLSKNEHLYLKNIYPELPEFFQVSYRPYLKAKEFRNTKSNTIIIGNNKSAYNNHSDIIDQIQNSPFKEKFKFLMFYNYGQDNFYTSSIKKQAKKIKEIEVVENFLPYEDFQKVYSDSSAFVLNGLRQMAMGNIWTAIKENTKIYLNKHNLVYQWLIEEGFYISSVENFTSDLENNNISLSKEQANSNQDQMIKFTEKYNKQNFHNTLFDILDKKLTIYHVHTDVKFINGVGIFNNKKFDNKLIVLGQNNTYQGPYKDQIQYFEYTRNEFKKIIQLCKSSDIVVLYGLNFQKSYIANRLPKSVKVIWRFFGSELYNLIPEFVFSEKTQPILSGEKKDGFILKTKKWIRFTSIQVKYRAKVKTEIKKAAFERADIFLGVFKDEYAFLKSKWNELPPFMQIGIPTIKSSSSYTPVVSNKIILGNNRSAYNNHLDILDYIDQSKKKGNYKFLMLYNYGYKDHYTETVRSRAAEIKEVEVIEDFMNLDKFNEIYEEADAFVMNGRRQMALGNLWEALKRNTKLYLNEKNITYKTLKEEGFVVFTIDDFVKDIENNNLKLTEVESNKNQKNLQIYSGRYNCENFHHSIKNLLNH
ncbi:TDP-N-acetylfucosamine:lipid II N-acetylfucosaminyltransferase [Brumimicrobium mesophilum]|uniref:TDP-N-acetylfucosamine:lipid II N-acetylfucosaminyltransferase n=1 Tax=Brumimicrobium mesophilum TaxID=392717 RepID=UPI000D143FF7|nr:TDP-N-acetylfucosamine:lipid II N-acetylfucosaminyltransferase [Brumimicrobium mesophilum]